MPTKNKDKKKWVNTGALPTNEDLATWAMESIELFADTTGLDAEVELDSATSDLLANMMHLCAQKGLDFDNLLRIGRSAFNEEVLEQEEADSPSTNAPSASPKM